MSSIDKQIEATSKMCQSWKAETDEDKKKEEVAEVYVNVNSTLREKI